MKKNCWVSFDTTTRAKTGYGIGPRTEGEGEVVLYRDTLEEVAAMDGSVHEGIISAAHAVKLGIVAAERQYAKLLKYQDAKAFLATDPDRSVTGAAGILLIDPAAYPSLYREYSATWELISPLGPVALALLIVQRAEETIDFEVTQRVSILEAESQLSTPVPEIPNE